MPRQSITSQSTERLTTAEVRRLLLGAQGLLDDPARRATPAVLNRLIHRLGFVQIDSINTVDRAHHLTLFSRLDGFQPAHLTHLLERSRTLFEHWTHDASVIPLAFYPRWKVRFHRFHQASALVNQSTWWYERLSGDPEGVLRSVRERIEREGPLRSADFEHQRAGESGAWWGWKPQKAALEYLWRTGELAIAGRVSFQKVYDFTERVLPAHHALERLDDEAYIDEQCAGAMERLVVATPREIAHFWGGVPLADARRWCDQAARSGRIVPVIVEPLNGADAARHSFALPDVRARLKKLPAAPERMRLLSPFDPVLRDRERAKRLFDFDYRFEAFVPAAKRVYGYYTMPVLAGERIVARVDPRHRREDATLEINRVWWEKGIKPTKALRAQLREAAERLAGQIGAEHVELRETDRRPRGRR